MAADIPLVPPPALLDLGELFGDAILFVDHCSGFLTSFERCQQLIISYELFHWLLTF